MVYLREYGSAYLKPGSLDRLRTSLLHVVRKLGKVRVRHHAVRLTLPPMSVTLLRIPLRS